MPQAPRLPPEMPQPVRLVLVSHAQALADATAAICRGFAGPDVLLTPVGPAHPGASVRPADIRPHLADGGPALLIADLGSAFGAAEAVAGDRPGLHLMRGAFVEGAVMAAVTLAAGGDLAAAAAAAGQALSLKQPAPERPPPCDGPDARCCVRLADRAGLHGRPAAEIALLAGAFEADIRIGAAATGHSASARSLTALLALGVTGPGLMEITATGPDADTAVEAIASVLATAADPEAPTPAQSPVQAFAYAPVHAHASAGPRPAAAGRGTGRVARLRRGRPPLPDAAPAVVDRAAEAAHLAEAINAVRHDLANRSGDALDVLSVQDAFLQDETLHMAISAALADGLAAAPAFARAAAQCEAAIAALSDPRLAARARDLGDAADAVLRVLTDMPPVDCAFAGPVVLLAEDLAPSEAARLDPVQIAAVIDRAGSAHTHAVVVLARRGIPAVVGFGDAPLPEGLTVTVDGSAGTVTPA